jgi:transcription initiation factor TFIIIB Brf1 subunit/transcription initiation factor TFIIB
MSTGLYDQLDPATYLPNEGRIDVEPEAYRFARDLLSAAYPSVEFQHFSRSGLAGSALYLASVAVSGRDRVSQAEIANLVGTTRMSIHAHTNRIARLAIKEINFTEHPSVS